MTMKDQFNEQLLVVRGAIRERQPRLDEAQHAVIKRINEIRADWKGMLIKGVDATFNTAVESMELLMALFGAAVREIAGISEAAEEPEITPQA